MHCMNWVFVVTDITGELWRSFFVIVAFDMGKMYALDDHNMDNFYLVLYNLIDKIQLRGFEN